MHVSHVRKVEVTPYDSTWPQRYEAEAARIGRIFGSEILAIDHIGSTSVPGLAAKPVVDILVSVRSIERIDLYNASMEAIGYEARGENGIPGRRYFQKGGHLRTHHVHMFQAGNAEIERHLTFRDYLRAHPDKAAAYGALKSELSILHPNDIEAYIRDKNDFVRTLDAEAARWRQET